MQLRTTNPGRKRAESGFVMPLCLVVIALLALTAVTLMQSLNSATARAQLQKDMLDREWAKHNVEQQIIWRALVQNVVASSRSGFEPLSPAAAQLQEAAGRWDTQFDAMDWNGVHANTDLPNGRFKVYVQDARGLLDLNYAQDAYLDYLTRLLKVPASSRRAAIGSVREQIAAFQQLTTQGDEGFRTKTVIGLTGKNELCRLRGWQDQPLCEPGTELFRYATFGSGAIPNVQLMPKHLKDDIGLKQSTDRLATAILEWESVQQSEGFYDPFQSAGGGGLRYHIWVHDESYSTRSFFALELVLDSGQRPFNISQRVDEEVVAPVSR